VVVVSEERGTISFCFNGNIAADLQPPQLRDMLHSLLSPKMRQKTRKARAAQKATDTGSDRRSAPRSTRPTGFPVGPDLRPGPEVLRTSGAQRPTAPTLPDHASGTPSYAAPPSAIPSSAPPPLRKSVVSSEQVDEVTDSVMIPAAILNSRPMPKAEGSRRRSEDDEDTSGEVTT